MLIIESAKLHRLLTQVNCRITSIARLRNAGAISDRKAEQEFSNRQLNFARSLCCRSMLKILPLTPRTRLGPAAPEEAHLT